MANNTLYRTALLAGSTLLAACGKDAAVNQYVIGKTPMSNYEVSARVSGDGLVARAYDIETEQSILCTFTPKVNKESKDDLPNVSSVKIVIPGRRTVTLDDMMTHKRLVAAKKEADEKCGDVLNAVATYKAGNVVRLKLDLASFDDEDPKKP